MGTIIKKLELQGFKSFPEKTKIVFHPGITAFVGPNGTGKSNIVDAILWVLGGQRLKSMRGEKTEDVIFNGSQKRAPLGMADVSLSLEDSGEELVLNHRVFRSGESEYRQNGKLVRLKDIQDDLWKRGIAEKQYFVIEQGAIGLFVTSKPAEKRLMLEEAAGTAYFKDKKKQAENKLENSEQNLVRLEDIIDEVGRSKNSLQRQAQAAARYRKLRERIRELEAHHFRRKIGQLEKNLAEVMARHGQCQMQEKEILSRISSEEREAGLKRKELWDLDKSLKQGQESLFSLKSQLARLESEKEKEIKRREFLEEKRRASQASGLELQAELEHLDKELQKGKSDLESLQKALALKRAEAEKNEQALGLELGQVEPWAEKVEKLRDDYLQKLAELTETKNERGKIEKEWELALRQEEKLRERIGQEQALLEEKERAIEKSHQEIAESKKQKEETEAKLAEFKIDLEKERAGIEELGKKIAELERVRNEQLHYLRALEKIAGQERMTGLSPELPHVLGLLADLIEAEDASIPLVDVFWKEEAKAAVILAEDFLRMLSEKNVKGNFLLLSREKSKELPREIKQDPRIIGFLKSRVRPKPKIQDFFFSLPEAAIVKDVRDAVETWLRCPDLSFVTLRGDVLFPSGFLKMGPKDEGFFALRQEIQKIEASIASQEKEISPLIQEREGKAREEKKLEEGTRVHLNLLDQNEKKIQQAEQTGNVFEAEKNKIKNDLSLMNYELEVLAMDKSGLSQRLEVSAQNIAEAKRQEEAQKAALEQEEKKLTQQREKNKDN
jgi:chromosome segregation protein